MVQPYFSSILYPVFNIQVKIFFDGMRDRKTWRKKSTLRADKRNEGSEMAFWYDDTCRVVWCQRWNWANSVTEIMEPANVQLRCIHQRQQCQHMSKWPGDVRYALFHFYKPSSSPFKPLGIYLPWKRWERHYIAPGSINKDARYMHAVLLGLGHMQILGRFLDRILSYLSTVRVRRRV